MNSKDRNSFTISLLDLPMNMAGYFVTDAEGYRGVVGTVIEGGILTAGIEIEVVYPK